MLASRRLFTLAAVACAMLSAAPADAGLFGNLLKRAPATPPPAHRAGAAWDWTGKPSEVTFKPAFAGVSYREDCRWVAFDQPYHWRFTVVNELKKTVTLRWVAYPFRKDYLYAIDARSTHVATLEPGGKDSIEGPAPLGCPNMRGGQNAEAYYYVLGDDLRIAGQSSPVRTGFFLGWNRQFAELARRQADAPSLEKGMSTALSLLTTTAAMACNDDEGCMEGNNY